MASQQVQPLRIQKSSAGSSPAKTNGLLTGRPLAELSPMAVRRNSPSFPQNNKGNIFKGDSSPFDSSPYNATLTNSPRLFWQGRDPTSSGRMSLENRSPSEQEQSPFPSKRSSIENLKKASRVKNSSIFAQEQKNKYDPSQPTLLDRPLASGRPLGMQIQGNAFVGRDLQSDAEKPASVHHTTSQAPSTPQTTISPQKSVAPLSPSKNNASPTKSSLSKRTGLNARNLGFDPENGIWSDDDDSAMERKLPEGRGLHRHAKSVTFDQAPPQVNEYEMTTPDPSSVASGSREGSYDSMGDDEELSFERGSSLDHDDSFDASLEDTDKTPVVMPEDWRFMSPDLANTEHARHGEDVFEDEYGSPAPNAQPGLMEYRPHQTSVNSIDSNGQPRPLPPLPATQQQGISPSESNSSLSGTVERLSSAQRFLPSPPQAPTVSKSEIRRMSGGVSMDDRHRLMMLQDPKKEKSEMEQQLERRMRRAGSKEPSPTRVDYSHDQGADAKAQAQPNSIGLDNAEQAPRISRESILRRLRSEQDLYAEAGYEDAPHPNPTSRHGLPLDPDVPIPSLEDPTHTTVEEITEERIAIKEESSDETDLYSIPDLYCGSQASENGIDDDDTSQYSQPSLAPPTRFSYDEGQDTPRAQSPIRESEKKSLPSERVSLPDFMDFGQSSSLDLGLASYLTPSPPLDEMRPPNPSGKYTLKEPALDKPLPDLATLRDSIQRPITPEDQLEPPHFPGQREGSAEPGTPESVIRHPVAQSPSPEPDDEEAGEPGPAVPLKDEPDLLSAPFGYQSNNREEASTAVTERSSIPECHHEQASLNATESTDENESRETLGVKSENKRVSSLVQLEIPRDQSDEGLGFGLEKEFDRVVEAQKVAFELSLARLHHPFHGRFPSSELPTPKDGPRQDVPQLIPRDIPNLRPQGARALPRDLRPRGHHYYPTDRSHCANRSPGRQRGYLMRQNTKVVVANNRIEDEPKAAPATTEPAQNTNDAAQVPRKISQPTWTAEPWNGKSRRKSIRGVDKSPRKKVADGPAPPLPGQASNAQDGLGAVHEDELAEEEAEEFEDGTERGRLFVKVVGLKDLDLPLPREESTHFALTLDNGLHCVTTAWLDLGRSAPIGQEFELVVLNELEFQLTLQMKLEEPKVERPQSPTKAPASPTKKQGAFGRLFGSPKKRKGLELQKQQEAEARQSAIRPRTPPSAYELVQGLVAKDGTFARAYVALNEHEKQAFGRPYSVDVTCFNEWAMEEVSVGSSRSKKSTVLQRKPPYPIGKLELQMLYVPKPKGAKDEEMPKSMNGAVRELREAETKANQPNQHHAWEGYLSQQGGDCPFWRRRFFKLAGTKLTAYHETTLQPRATINLAKASKLIDDRPALTQKEVSTKSGRRKSAFAEEEEGYMFVEEGFRIRFANGEIIDFYADSAAAKDGWMKALCEVVGKGTSSGTQAKRWTDIVLKREKSAMAKDKKTKAETAAVPSSPTRGSKDRQKQMQAQASEMPIRPASAREQPTAGLDFGGPSADAKAQHRTQAPRPQGHLRTESYQPQSYLPQPTSKSQASSPVKTKMSAEEKRKKTRSMIDMMYQ